MKRKLSTGLLVVYWIALPVLVLSIIGIFAVPLMQGSVTYPSYLPGWVVPSVTCLLPIIVIWRLWIHMRARRAASNVAAAVETEDRHD